MYDVDGNGWIDIIEMTKIVKSIYCMMGPQTESAEKRAKEIFRRMDRYLNPMGFKLIPMGIEY